MLGIAILLALLLLFFTARTLYVWNRLRHIPGPFSAGFSKWWLLKRTMNGTIHMESAQATFQYGEVTQSHKSAVKLTAFGTNLA